MPAPRLLALTLLTSLVVSPAEALVGVSEEGGAMAPHVLMVLASRPGASGFCTGAVIAQDVILTAAHCVAAPRNTRIMIPMDGALTFVTPDAVAIHPEYRPKAPQTRERSIDLALLKLAAPLPEALKPAAIDGRAPQTGARYGVAGYGVTREGAGESAGVLRWGELMARAPLSKILLWAEDPRGRGFGVCEGDSGGPIFALDTSALLAITSWSAGDGKTRCGQLTQAALIAPQRGWITGVLRGWGVTP